MASCAWAKEYHVSVSGSDANSGSASQPLKTISAAAQIAQPGDEITVHEGTYRERVNPPRGGASDVRRITYQAADGAKVVIKGSEVATGRKRTPEGLWKLSLPNAFFGDYNPYHDLISGDWFSRRDRDHHTGEIYLNGNALFETVSLDTMDAVEGNQSLKLVVHRVDGPGWRSAGLFQVRPAKAKSSYKVSFWLKNQGCKTRLTIRNEGKDPLFGPSEAERRDLAEHPPIRKTLGEEETGTNTWRQFEYIYAVPETDGSIRFELNIIQPGTLWIDDMRIEEVQT